MIIIKCDRCKIDKEEQFFNIFRGRRNKWCIECRNRNNTWYSEDIHSKRTKAKEYYRRNFDRIKIYRFKQALIKKYGISIEQFDLLLQTQKNKCAVCDKQFSRKEFDTLPQVDHCHTTKKVRGILCRACNLVLIPIVERKYHLIAKAKSYLESTK